jgi:hypothetical protein
MVREVERDVLVGIWVTAWANLQLAGLRSSFAKFFSIQSACQMIDSCVVLGVRLQALSAIRAVFSSGSVVRNVVEVVNLGCHR